MVAFLMTWKADKWPHENILRMVSELKQSGSVVEAWRISAHTQAYVGAKVWLLKQGTGEKGIFGYGEMIERPHLGQVFEAQDQQFVVPVRFSKLTDPLSELLVPEDVVRRILNDGQIRTQSSGITVTDAQSQELVEALISSATSFSPIAAELVDEVPFDPDNANDLRERTLRSIATRRGQGRFRLELMAAYNCRCALTNCAVEHVLEAAHIFPYLGAATNDISNGLLLRSDIHTLFDCGLIGFTPENLEIVLSAKLAGSTYEKLRGRRLRKPAISRANPNKKALSKHLSGNGLVLTSSNAGSSATPD